MVVVEILGVGNDNPEPMAVPPVAALYQFIVPALGVADKVTDPSLHLIPGVTDDTVGIVFMVTVIGVLTVVAHPLAVDIAAIKYDLFAEREGVVYELPEFNIVDEEFVLYQFIVLGISVVVVNVNVPVPHLVADVGVITGILFTVALTATLAEIHPLSIASA